MDSPFSDKASSKNHLHDFTMVDILKYLEGGPCLRATEVV
jgi:hypothetical protein